MGLILDLVHEQHLFTTFLSTVDDFPGKQISYLTLKTDRAQTERKG